MVALSKFMVIFSSSIPSSSCQNTIASVLSSALYFVVERHFLPFALSFHSCQRPSVSSGKSSERPARHIAPFASAGRVASACRKVLKGRGSRRKICTYKSGRLLSLLFRSGAALGCCKYQQGSAPSWYFLLVSFFRVFPFPLPQQLLRLPLCVTFARRCGWSAGEVAQQLPCGVVVSI